MADQAMAEPHKPFPPNSVHAVRTAQQIHMAHSQMADQKANMLLAATFLIFTIAIGAGAGDGGAAAAADPGRRGLLLGRALDPRR
jgi:hypothetical protein